ncbi:hypothetical protein ACLIBG_15150 [Virgibacillus sp. W0181]|uniref:hypothetical protein n=1 Tax=Virgibacillus sp. W0181 TaxID=3391581 RepID=UPI003F47E170
MKFVIAPFTDTISELKLVKDLSQQVEENEKSKVKRFVYFNILFFVIYIILYLSAVLYLFIGLFISPIGFIPLLTTVITIVIARALQIKVYPKLKENYFKNIS